MFEVMHFQDILTEAKFRLKTYGSYIHDEEPGTIGDSVQEQMNYLETTCNELFGIEVASVSDEVHTRYFPLADVESIFYCSAPSLATTWGDSVCCYIVCREHSGLIVEHMSATRVLETLATTTTKLSTITEQRECISWIAPQAAEVKSNQLALGQLFFCTLTHLVRFFVKSGYPQPVGKLCYRRFAISLDGDLEKLPTTFDDFPPRIGEKSPRMFPSTEYGDDLEYLVLQHLLRVPKLQDDFCSPACLDSRPFAEKTVDKKLLAEVLQRIASSTKQVDFSFQETENNRNELISVTGFVHNDWLCQLSLWTLLHIIEACMKTPEVFLYEKSELGRLQPLHRAALLRVCAVFPRKRPTLSRELQVLDVQAMRALLVGCEGAGGRIPTLADVPLCTLHPKSSRFQLIHTNDTAHVSPDLLRQFEPDVGGHTIKCDCQSTCTLTCSKRTTELVLCSVVNCSLAAQGKHCGNRYEDIGSSLVEAGWSGKEQLGNALWCTQHVVAGTILTEMTGELRVTPANADANYYLMELPQLRTLPKLYLDSSRKGNKGRFANHSCCPNAEYVVFINERGLPVVFIRSTVDIPGGCMVTVQYGPQYHKFDCVCGHICCSSKV